MANLPVPIGNQVTVQTSAVQSAPVEDRGKRYAKTFYRLGVS